MLYNATIKQTTLDALAKRVSSVVDVSISLINEGYIPNRSKSIKLQVGLMLIDAFENMDVLSIEQHRKIENLYNKFISL